MLGVQNTIGINLGSLLQGHAEGPLGRGALLLIAAMVLIALRRP
jgi:hypothetical protein